MDLPLQGMKGPRDLLSVEWRNVVAIKTMLDSAGWKIFQEKLTSLYDSTLCEIEEQTRGFVNQEGVNRLNYLLAKKNTLEQILLLKEEMLDDIENSPQEEAVHNSSPNQEQVR